MIGEPAQVTAWAGARRILAIRLDRMGDVLMTTPAIRALREGRPSGARSPRRHVTLLASSSGAIVAPLVPEVDEAIVYDPPWMKATRPRVDSDVDLRLVERLRASAFDAAVVFTAFSQDSLPAALTAYLARIPLRLAHCRENPYQLLTDWVPEPEPSATLRHEVRRQLDLVASVGFRTGDERLSIRPGGEARARVGQLLGAAGLGGAMPWVVIHPGSTAPSRRYPGFEAVARMLSALAGWRVVVTGSAEEAELAAAVARAAGPGRGVSLAGRLTLAELAALIERAPLLISNNSGPVHVASATGTPVVDLYALTNPQHTPWGVPARVLYRDVPCRFCYKSVCPEGHHACLAGVPAEEVVTAALELADSAGARPLAMAQGRLAVDPPLAGLPPALPADREMQAGHPIDLWGR